MTRFSKGKRVQGLILVLAAAGAIGVSYSAMPSFAAGSPTIEADDMDANAKALATLDDEWSKVAATKDADRVAEFYAEDAIAYPPNEPVAVGRAAAKKVWASYFVDKTFSISWKITHTEVSKSGELGFTSGTYEDSYTGPDGKLVSEKG